ncbi:MAG: selenocysteine-specific translation elongation factor [Spirochaetaceae bacterium]|jgi:selenocysteine-specific elongation factor|nr:selenocysteine-specific translation elongation factor [Spirochaetaceae bacterium]
MEYPFIIGTAGHIDHGKTALVRALTGIDCDRLEEEKRRGITIELGFAPLSLADGRTVSIVDVPGHERFIRQMAAGASGMDAGILVISATEGVMPQTREHLDILSILGVRFGLVALTKKDVADEETLALAAEEAAELIQGSCLDGAAIIPVSAVTSEGIPQILEEIARILDKIPPRKGFGAFFLPVDRVFSKKGFGSVVTGTSYQGTVHEGDEVEVMPEGVPARVRSLQTHGAKTAQAAAGQRVAINLSAVSHDGLERGDAVCAKGAFLATDCISAHLEVLPSAPQAVSHWQRVRLHVGTVDVVARIALLRLNAAERSKGYLPGTGGPVQLLTESKITAAAGQRFVIRFYSPLVTIGGGRIMLPNGIPARGKADREAKAALVEELNADFRPHSLLAALVQDRGALSQSGLFALSQMDKSAFTEYVNELSSESAAFGLLLFGKARNFISNGAFDTAALKVTRTLKKFHAANPELAGLDVEKLAASIDSIFRSGGISAGDCRELLARMAEQKIIAAAAASGKSYYRLADFERAIDGKFTALVSRVKDGMAAAGFNLLKAPELEAKLAVPAADLKRSLVFLREEGELWTLEGELLFSRELRDRLLELLAAMQDDITVAALRDAAGVNRKLALSMLDFLDTHGFTRREGDKRILVKNGEGG